LDEFTTPPESQLEPLSPLSPEYAQVSTPLIPPPPKRGLRWIFVGDNGIRAGWGILLFILLFIGFQFLNGYFVLRPLFGHHRQGAVIPARAALILESTQFVCVFLATLVMALIERKRVTAYGYQGAARAARFLWGLVWGFVSISALVFALWKSHLLAFDGRLLHGEGILKYAVAWGIMFLLVGLFEESTTRGYLQYTMTRGVGFWWGALLFSFLFGFAHHGNPGESPIGLFSAGAIGLIFCLSLWYTGSLWWAVGFHAAWDWGQSYFYGKLLWSGGLTGPEGSALIIPLLIIITLAMWLWWRHRVISPFAGQGLIPAWVRSRRALPAAASESIYVAPAAPDPTITDPTI
jgi:membrane protease YdiL (CAAX protease family)